MDHAGRVMRVRAFVGRDHQAGILACALHALPHGTLWGGAPVVVSAAMDAQSLQVSELTMAWRRTLDAGCSSRLSDHICAT